MEVVGYCTIKKDATTGRAKNIDQFLGKDLRVLEFNKEGDVLVINSEATEMAMFEKVDVYRKFECSFCGDVICPPGMELTEQLIYSYKVLNRKGGYNNLLRNMVIQCSLLLGKFDDRFLFAKQ